VPYGNGFDRGGGGIPLLAQTEKSLTDKVSLDLEFNASILSANSDGVVDSMTDAGFNEDETKIGISYEGEFWGASASLKFRNENLRFLSGEIGEMFSPNPLMLDELYGWIKPFGEHFKFTGGIFENKDGIADYTDDIDDFAMGVFLPGEEAEGNPFFSEPEAIMTAPFLTDGFLTDLIFGPVTLQLLLAANFSKESASDLVSGLLTSITQSPIPVDADARFFRIGGRVIIDAGVGTFSALFKTFQWPTAVEVAMATAFQASPNSNLTGSKQNYHTFGGYFDLTAVENLGVSLGYTGFITAHDGEDVDNILYSGIDLRATWTGIEGLSLSTHNNVSFAKGSEKDWFLLRDKDTSFFNLYNAIGATKEFTEKFSVNAEISNVFSKTDLGDNGKLEYDNLGIVAKFIAKVGEHAEFNAGLRLDVENATVSGGDDKSVTTFSIPIGIKVNF
jgi:hypothetical protein